MGEVIPMPGIDPATIRPRPTCIADLAPGAKALVVVPHGKAFRLVLSPATTLADREAWLPFPYARDALAHARRLSARYPGKFPLVLDETPRSLDRLVGPGPDPMNLGGAA